MHTSINHLLRQYGVFNMTTSQIIESFSGKTLTKENIVKLHSNLKPYKIKSEITLKREISSLLKSSVSEPSNAEITPEITPEMKDSVIIEETPTSTSTLTPTPILIPKRTKFNLAKEEKDQLFWLFYICKNGIESYDEFQIVSNLHKFNHEKRLKFDLIDIVRPLKKQLKIARFALSDIENDLGNLDLIGLPTFLALCFVHNISLVLVIDKIIHKNPIINYIEEDSMKLDSMKMDIDIKDDSVQPEWVLFLDSSTIHKSHSEYTLVHIKELTMIEKHQMITQLNSKYKIQRMDKPINAITAYSKEELNLFATQFGIPIQNSQITLKGPVMKIRTKRDIYDDIKMALKLLIPSDWD